MPRVSAIITTRNRPSLLARAIDSVRAQTYRDFELIVVDDGSTDETPAPLAEYERAGSLRAHRIEVAKGANHARNQGLRLAQGEYLAFLDDDDQWLPRKLQQQAEVFDTTADAAVVSCWFLVRGEVRTRPREIPYRAVLSKNIVGGFSMCMVRARDVLAVGAMDEGLGSCQDWDLWLRLAELGRVMVVPECLVDYGTSDPARITRQLDRIAHCTNHLTVVKRYQSKMGFWPWQRHQAMVKYHTTPVSQSLLRTYWRARYGLALLVDSIIVGASVRAANRGRPPC